MSRICKKDLDNRICDVEPGATNTETYREFIVNSLHYFYGPRAYIPNLDRLTEDDLNDVIEELDWLWEK